MILEQGQTAESPARYSAEEVREILRLAASLQENTFSVEQLRAIAREAGIADEPLERAIQHYEQSHRKKSRRRLYTTPRWRKFKRVVWTLAATGVILVLSLLWNIADNVRMFANDTRDYSHEYLMYALRSHTFPLQRRVEFAQMTPLASSPTLEVYKISWTSWEWREGTRSRVPQERVYIKCSGKPILAAVEHRFRQVVAAEISPSGKYVALHDAGTGEVWVVDAQGKVQLGTRIGIGLPHGSQNGAERSPTLKWRTRGSNEMLHIRLADKREITIPL